MSVAVLVRRCAWCDRVYGPQRWHRPQPTRPDHEDGNDLLGLRGGLQPPRTRELIRIVYARFPSTSKPADVDDARLAAVLLAMQQQICERAGVHVRRLLCRLGPSVLTRLPRPFPGDHVALAVAPFRAGE